MPLEFGHEQDLSDQPKKIYPQPLFYTLKYLLTNNFFPTAFFEFSINISLQHFAKLDPVHQVDQLVVDLEHAGAEGQPHEAAHVGEEAVEVVDDVLLLLDVGPLVDGQHEERVGIFRSLVPRVGLGLDLQVKLFLLARWWAEGRQMVE